MDAFHDRMCYCDSCWTSWHLYGCTLALPVEGIELAVGKAAAGEMEFDNLNFSGDEDDGSDSVFIGACCCCCFAVGPAAAGHLKLEADLVDVEDILQAAGWSLADTPHVESALSTWSQPANHSNAAY